MHMKDNNKIRTIKYVRPPFEEAQHNPTLIDDEGIVRRVSLHSDVSLLLRIERLKNVSQAEISMLKEHLQPLIDSSPVRSELEDAFGSFSDNDLINSVPSRYISTLSEKQDYLRQVAEHDKQERSKLAKEAKDAEEKKKLEDEENLLRDNIQNFLNNAKF